MRLKDEDGQAIILVALAMSIFLIGAVGLAVDGSNLYTQRQFAQAAADAAAQAGMMSIFDGTNTITGNAADFTAGTAFTCSSTSADARTPCSYANKNGFGGTSTDTVAVTFPTSVSGVTNLSTADTVNLITVTVSRNVNTTLMRLLGPTVTTVSASATAAIVSVVSPTPILITDPKNSNTLSMNGNTSITICGGPTRSIQINSSSTQAYTGGGTVNLQNAGPLDTGNCSTGTGADFGVFGGDSTDAATGNSVELGTLPGKYLSKASPVQDPLANVAAPSSAGLSPGTTTTITTAGTHGCNLTPCIEYTPGTYSSLNPGKNNIIFDPGLYYIEGGGVNFKQMVGGGGAPDYNAMCVGCAADPNTGTGMVIYDTVPNGTAAYPASRPTGGFAIQTNAQFAIQGANNTTTNAQGRTVPASPYFGILLFEDRTANAQTHNLGQGNGCFTLIGTIYITNTLAIMQNTADAAYPNHVQSVSYNGGPCSTTTNQGDIIVGQLSIVGGSAIKMNLLPYGFLSVRQVAMVN